jgi:hypothetical protein
MVAAGGRGCCDVCVLGDDARSPAADQRALAPRFDIAKTLAPRMQRLELRPGAEPIHAS